MIPTARRKVECLAAGLALFCFLGASEAHAREPGPSAVSEAQARIVERARDEIGRVRRYAGEWMPTSGYPMGDIPADRGACTDLVVRALRAAGIDLQRLVHEDILRAPDAYGLRRPDRTVDHRRASTLLVYFRRQSIDLSSSPRGGRRFLPGDVVFVRPSRTSGRLHVAIVSDRIGPRGLPLVIENGGPRPAETDSLGLSPIVGHFRPAVMAASEPVARVLEALLEE